MNRFLLLYCVIFFCLKATSQNQFQVQLSSGATHYYGDVATQFNVENVRHYTAVNVLSSLGRKVHVLLGLEYARIAGIDSLKTNTAFQRKRNLNFFTDIYSLRCGLQQDVIQLARSRYSHRSSFIAYLREGVGISYFDPKTCYNNQVYHLAALKTSGVNYSQVNVQLFGGVGADFSLAREWSVGLELTGSVFSSSDLDDIRGTSIYPDPVEYTDPTVKQLAYRGYQEYQVTSKTMKHKQRGRLGELPDFVFTAGLTVTYHIR